MSATFGRRARALLLGTVLAATVTVALPAVSAARKKPKHPDLKISSGTVTASGAQLSGSFVVANGGRAAAGASSATVGINVGGQTNVVQTLSVGKLKPSKSQTLSVSASAPAGLAAGSYPIVACADSAGVVKEGSESNNCRGIGTLTVTGSTPPPPPSGSTVPTAPIAYQANTPQDVTYAGGDYWVDVPPSYGSDNQTPETLLVWLHGCGGQSSGDIYEVSPGNDRNYIAIAPGGREASATVDGCWNTNATGDDEGKVMGAIADAKKHFNINPRRVIVAGYSSGGDLAYRTIFYNANTFAGILAINTSPFRDTGSTQAQSLAAAAWKFNDVHIAHSSDETYPLAGVTNEINAMKQAGFPVNLIVRPGTHYDDDNNAAGTGTYYDIHHYLLPHIDDGWLAPAG